MSNKSSNLQDLALKNVLEGLIIDEEMKKVIDEYILKQLAANPLLISKAIDQTGLYCVFFRERDPYTQKSLTLQKEISCYDIQLLISFPTEKQAIDWIIANGRNIVLSEKNNRERSVVLTIIGKK